MNVRLLVPALSSLLLAAHAGLAAPKDAPSDLSDALFAGPWIPHLQIEIAAEDLDRLRQYEWNRTEPDQARAHVLATVREGRTVYTNVTLHLKGAAGSFRPLDDKPALTLQFEKAAEGQRFHDLQKIHLNNSVQDPSYVSEILCRELFRAAGLPTPRATQATVTLNDRPLGVYVLVEGWNKQFLKRHFANTHGNLWDGGFARDITAPLVVNSGDRPEDRSPLDQLLEAAGEPGLTNRLNRLQRVLDLDRFLTFIAMEVMLVHWDGYTMNRNNYRIFHDLESGRLVFLAHGLDQMFGVWRTRPDHSITPQMRGLVAKAVLQTAEGRRRYLSRMSELFTNVFRVEAMTNRVQELAARLRPALQASPNSLQRHERFVSALEDRIRRREESLREQLAEAITPLRFDRNGVARLTRWSSKADDGNPSFDRVRFPLEVLQITASGSPAYGSWRTSVLLEQGDYRLEGRVKTEALEFGPGVNRGGVTLRLSGDRAATMQVRLPQWTRVTHDFSITGLEDVELVCELRASRGWAWFEAGSLQLVRRPKSPR